jgi:hypothetical protein
MRSFTVITVHSIKFGHKKQDYLYNIKKYEKCEKNGKFHLTKYTLLKYNSLYKKRGRRYAGTNCVECTRYKRSRPLKNPVARADFAIIGIESRLFARNRTHPLFCAKLKGLLRRFGGEIGFLRRLWAA